MANVEVTYQFSRRCTKCGWSEERAVKQRDAAFRLVPSSLEPCPICSAKSWASSLEQPMLTPELLMEWATDATLSLLEQDEELLLADYTHIDALLAVLDNGTALPEKRGIIVEALCIVVYDNLNPENPLPSSERERIADDVIDELLKRMPTVLEHKNAVMDYVQKVVFPRLGMPV